MWRKVVSGRRVKLHTEPLWASGLFTDFFMNSSETVGPGGGDLFSMSINSKIKTMGIMGC